MTFQTPSTVSLTSSAALLGLILSACSGGATEDSAAPGQASAAPSATTSYEPPPTIAAVASELVKGKKIAVDFNGLTLYVYAKDTKKASACVDKCAEEWPPLISDSGNPVAFPDIRSTDIGTIEREDGSKQVTLKGKPLYRYSKDERPGETKGKAVRGWEVAIAPK